MTIAEVHTSEDVLVIGAGPAGIAMACQLEQAGIRYLVIDRAEQIGSTWNSLYPSLRLNTSRYFSHMPGEPFPREYGLFPSGRQYHDYLTRFAEKHNFNVRLGVTVRRVAPDGDLWRVETDQGVWLVPAVVSATGIFGRPVWPDIPHMDRFTGRMLHAHDVRDPSIFTGERVLIVGSGPSGVDLSVAAGHYASQAVIAIRSGIMLKRRYPLGLPMHAWLLLTEHLPRPWCRAIMKRLGSFGYPDQEQYDLLKPPPGGGGITAYQGPELLDAVRRGDVTPLNTAPVDFDGRRVIFSDGRVEEFDSIIMATGYEPVLHEYLDIDIPLSDEPFRPQSICDWEIGPNGQRGWPLRDTSEHPNSRQVLGYPGLYLVGVFYKGKGALYNMNIEARIATEQIQQQLARRAEAVKH